MRTIENGHDESGVVMLTKKQENGWSLQHDCRNERFAKSANMGRINETKREDKQPRKQVSAPRLENLTLWACTAPTSSVEAMHKYCYSANLIQNKQKRD